MIDLKPIIEGLLIAVMVSCAYLLGSYNMKKELDKQGGTEK